MRPQNLLNAVITPGSSVADVELLERAPLRRLAFHEVPVSSNASRLYRGRASYTPRTRHGSTSSGATGDIDGTRSGPHGAGQPSHNAWQPSHDAGQPSHDAAHGPRRINVADAHAAQSMSSHQLLCGTQACGTPGGGTPAQSMSSYQLLSDMLATEAAAHLSSNPAMEALRDRVAALLLSPEFQQVRLFVCA